MSKGKEPRRRERGGGRGLPLSVGSVSLSILVSINGVGPSTL